MKYPQWHCRRSNREGSAGVYLLTQLSEWLGLITLSDTDDQALSTHRGPCCALLVHRTLTYIRNLCSLTAGPDVSLTVLWVNNRWTHEDPMLLHTWTLPETLRRVHRVQQLVQTETHRDGFIWTESGHWGGREQLLRSTQTCVCLCVWTAWLCRQIICNPSEKHTADTQTSGRSCDHCVHH